MPLTVSGLLSAGAIAATPVLLTLTSCARSPTPTGHVSDTAEGSSALDGSALLSGGFDGMTLWDTARTFRPANFNCLYGRMMVWGHGYAVCDGRFKRLPSCACHWREAGLDDMRVK
jgi:hypothetical protein